MTGLQLVAHGRRTQLTCTPRASLSLAAYLARPLSPAGLQVQAEGLRRVRILSFSLACPICDRQLEKVEKPGRPPPLLLVVKPVRVMLTVEMLP